MNRQLAVLPRTGRRFPIGAEPGPGGTHFRVWAPARKRVAVVFEGSNAGNEQFAPFEVSLKPEAGGYFSGLVPGVAAGFRYRFRLDDNENLHPDPASRFQPMGPHVSSEVIDPLRFRWTDAGWRGVPDDRHILYELHVGTFTGEGTWKAAGRFIPDLRALGVTTIQIMPIADFPGHFGWGYDGVNMFAPTRLYGHPDDFRAFVDRAHAEGLAVILDVVYNHLGPDGNYMEEFTGSFYSTVHKTDWGQTPNFDRGECAPVREYFIANARYWIEEFHLDGLRLDATQDIFDESDTHITGEIAAAAREAGAGREIFILAENEPQNTALLRGKKKNGLGLTAAQNDDFHHAAFVALTGWTDAYFTDYRGTPQEFVSLAKYGYLYQGQYYHWQKQLRGTATRGVRPWQFVNYLESHDQIPNTGRGFRLHKLSCPGCYRALTALLLLSPQTPMLFQGQEFGSSAPFYYFADHFEELAARVAKGRRKFMHQFPGIATAVMEDYIPGPDHPETFVHSRLDHGEREKHRTVWQLHRDLIALRRNDDIFRAPPGGIDGAVLGAGAFVLRYFGQDGDDRLLLVNLGRDLDLVPAPEPLLAPPAGRAWQAGWSSEHPAYGGHGIIEPERDGVWNLRGKAATAMTVTERKNG